MNYLNLDEYVLVLKTDLVAEVKKADPVVQPQRTTGFAARFYKWLAVKERSESEVDTYVLNPVNSNNVHNHLTHYQAIGNMIRGIWQETEME